MTYQQFLDWITVNWFLVLFAGIVLIYIIYDIIKRKQQQKVIAQQMQQQAQQQTLDMPPIAPPGYVPFNSVHFSSDFKDAPLNSSVALQHLKLQRQQTKEEIKKKYEMYATAKLQYKELEQIGQQLLKDIPFLEEHEKMLTEQIKRLGGK